MGDQQTQKMGLQFDNSQLRRQDGGLRSKSQEEDNVRITGATPPLSIHRSNSLNLGNPRREDVAHSPELQNLRNGQLSLNDAG